jgi:hypothetical protein
LSEVCAYVAATSRHNFELRDLFEMVSLIAFLVLPGSFVIAAHGLIYILRDNPLWVCISFLALWSFFSHVNVSLFRRQVTEQPKPDNTAREAEAATVGGGDVRNLFGMVLLLAVFVLQGVVAGAALRLVYILQDDPLCVCIFFLALWYFFSYVNVSIFSRQATERPESGNPADATEAAIVKRAATAKAVRQRRTRSGTPLERDVGSRTPAQRELKKLTGHFLRTLADDLIQCQGRDDLQRRLGTSPLRRRREQFIPSELTDGRPAESASPSSQ